MGKPGVMFYFDIRPCIKRLSYEDKGRLFEAILDYGQSGTIPEFDGVLGIAWDFIQPRLDYDSERYDGKIDQRRYAVYVREAKKRGILPLSFDEWAVVPDAKRHQWISSDIGRYPTTTSTSTSNIREAGKPPTRPRFSPPSVEEVAAYCQEKGYPVDAGRFVDYYASVGWKRGNTSIKDWKAAVRTWARKDSPHPAAPEPKNCGYVLAPPEDPWEAAMRKQQEAGRV